ncbi:reverse transcriptase domain-containing protein [Tanacetum coccineum]
MWKFKILILQDLINLTSIPREDESEREQDKPSAQHSRFLKMFKQLRLEIGLKDALVEMPKFNKWLSSLLKNKEKLKEIAITTVNAEYSAIIMNKVPEKLKDPGKFLIPCALQELNRTSALDDVRASINLLPHSIYKKLGLEALTPTRMTLELANRSITHPMGIAEDVVVRVDGFTFLADFVVVNFEPDLRVPIILGRPFLRTAKALIDLYEETLTLRVGKEELVYYADKSEKNKNKHCVHAISNFSVLVRYHRGNDNLTLKKVLHEENFQVNSNPLFEFDDNFKSSTINPLFDEIEENVEIKNSNVSDEPVLLNTPLSDKVECFTPEDNNDEIDDFLAMEVFSNFEEGYFDSEGDVTFLDNLLSDDASHNLTSEVISDHEPEQNEYDHQYFSLQGVILFTMSLSSQGNVHANQSSVIESFPVSPIPVEDSEPTQEEIDIFLVPDDLIPPGVENDDSEDEVNESPNLDHQDDPSIPRPPPEPPDVEKCFEPEAVKTPFLTLASPLRAGGLSSGWNFHVRIYQKSHENSQKQASTDTRIRRVQKEAKESKPKPEKSSLSQIQLELPQELSRVHHTFHVSNLKKCYADEPLVMPLEGIHVDDKLQFVEEPVEIMEREIKRLKRSRIPLVKVRWNSRRGPEFTWEREDSFKQKYPQLFTNRASSSTTRS